MKKGAMFGLDARIALAIFGALSVISGAALYSAIEESKMTTFHTNLVEIEKAVEQMYLDIGSLGWAGESAFKIGVLSNNLISSPISNWNGPYVESTGAKATSSSDDYILKHVYFSDVRGVTRPTRTENDTFACTAGVAGPDTNVYLRVDDKFDTTGCNGNLNYLKKIHDKYDSDGDYSDGKIKVIADTTNTDEGSLFYRIDVLKRMP
tara:strand:+ start:1225 stop:1845 length:621 start_codon:yes stop_codon:yes gene_type:complete